MSFLRLVFIFGVCFLISNNLKATHIVGGEVTYRHIQQDSFEITLILYIDCFNGSPSAVSQDTIAILGIFNKNDSLVQLLKSGRSLPLRVNSVNYNCVQPPSNECVDKYTYVYYTNLPQGPGAYTITFQRCCRNGSIDNIAQPGNTGATYWTEIPDTMQSFGYNTAAVFNGLPPNFVCNNRAFVFNHSASDADGDSLAYSLYTPYNGASTAQPRPTTPVRPPYPLITWLPPYSATGMMLGSPELAIDPLTGIISVNPKNVGQFVVGIQVKEYRRGRLINTTRRDFQFNVLDCLFDAVSSFSNDLTLCSDTVRFVNKSTGATSYQWDFGDPNTTTDVSTDKDPVYVYPGPATQGSYTARLVVSDGNCYDSAFVKIVLLKDTARFAGPDTSLCMGGPLKLGSPGPAFSYLWTPALYLDNPALAEPTSTTIQDIEYIATRKNNWCTNTDSVKIRILRLDPSFTATALPGCKNALVMIDSLSPFTRQSWFLNEQHISFEDLLKAKLLFDSAYTIKLLVDSNACPDYTERTIKPVFGDSIDFIPNVFTPNGDGWNDCYSIGNIILSPECSQVLIYNRWGLVVFDSDKHGSCWDGTWNGNAVADGSYYYILNYRNKTFHGVIALTRE